jgi:CarD family transcriptional regulator
LAQGKKITSLDERYMKAAENELYNELSLSLGVPKAEMEHYLREQLRTGA